MQPIPTAHKEQIKTDPRFKICARHDPDCQGRITVEHAFTYSGRQINELWAYVPLCWYHHLGAGLNKEINRWISLQQATAADLAKYPRFDWKQLIKYLNSKHGKSEYSKK